MVWKTSKHEISQHVNYRIIFSVNWKRVILTHARIKGNAELKYKCTVTYNKNNKKYYYSGYSGEREKKFWYAAELLITLHPLLNLT